MTDSVKKPLVTIGVPVFNGEAYIRDALDSLVQQNYENFEIVVSDNCSSDKTPIVLKEYSHKFSFIRLHRNSENIGSHGNFIRLVELAKGEYFMWAAVDDHWSASFVSTLVKELEAHPDAGVAMSAFDRVHSDGNQYDRIRFLGKQNPNQKGFLRMALGLTSPLKYNVFIYGLFRTCMLRSTIRTLLPTPSGDRWFLTQFALAFRIRYVDHVLHTRTLHSVPYQNRYPEDDFVRRKILWANDIFNFRSVHDVYRAVADSGAIPSHRKMYLPILLASVFFRRLLKGVRKGTLQWLRRSLPVSVISACRHIRRSISN